MGLTQRVHYGKRAPARTQRSRITLLGMLLLGSRLAGLPDSAAAQVSVAPTRSRDRGVGVPASIFATYVARGQLVVFPFFAYSRDDNREYQPAKLGFGLNEDFLGRYRSFETQLFVAYGLTDRLVVEVEAGHVHATLGKAPDDSSATPARITESGLADVEGQLRLRLLNESDRRPEVFSYLEITAPSQRRKVLIGDRIWDLRPGLGLVRGFSWGTLTTRITVEYNHDDAQWDLGEFSVEYLKRLSPHWRVNLAFEGGETGAPDEWDLVSGVQWSVADFLDLRFDNAVGITPKATDWAPQIGVLIRIPH
jgi:hypothetical protein